MMLSVPHHGQATVNRPAVVLEATTGVFTAGLAFLRPSELPPSAVPKPVRYMPGWYADFSSWGSQLLDSTVTTTGAILATYALTSPGQDGA
jgi:hypothetical protein